MATIIKLHSHSDGNPVYINQDLVEEFYIPKGYEYTQVTSLDSTNQVKETPGEIWKQMLEAERAKKLFLDHGPDA